MQTQFVRSWIWTSILGLWLLGTTSVASAQTNPPFAYLPDVGFRATPAESLPVGVHYDVEAGPTGGPYRTTQFFEGVISSEGSGAWSQRDNAWAICFNLVNCSGQRILTDMYDFSYVLESAYQAGPTWPTLIEENFNVRYADGTVHRPWAMHIRTEDKSAVLNFSSEPGKISFQVNQNGNTVIGNPFRQPREQLEVVGDALITGDLEVQGGLEVDGSPVMTVSSSPSSGPLRWGVSVVGGVGSAGEVCEQAGMGCGSALLPSGQLLACSARFSPGVVFFALCR